MNSSTKKLIIVLVAAVLIAAITLLVLAAMRPSAMQIASDQVAQSEARLSIEYQFISQEGFGQVYAQITDGVPESIVVGTLYNGAQQIGSAQNQKVQGNGETNFTWRVSADNKEYTVRFVINDEVTLSESFRASN